MRNQYIRVSAGVLCSFFWGMSAELSAQVNDGKAQNQGALVTTVEPVRKSIKSNEAIELSLTIRNTFNHPVSISANPPFRIPVSFQVDGAIERLFVLDTEHEGGQVEIPKDKIVFVLLRPQSGKWVIPAGEQVERRCAVNRSLWIDHTGPLIIHYVARPTESQTPERYRAKDLRSWSSEGSFEIVIEEGPARPEVIEDLKRRAGDPDPTIAADAAELLRWTKDPAAIEPIRDYALKHLDTAVWDVLALEKFMTHPEAQKGLHQIGLAASTPAFETVLGAYRRAQLPVPLDVLKRGLTSPGTILPYATLQYLENRPEPGVREELQHLVEKGKPALAEKAKRVLAKTPDSPLSMNEED